MYCTQCGKPVSDQARFCSSCGARITARTASDGHVLADTADAASATDTEKPGHLAPSGNTADEDSSLVGTSASSVALEDAKPLGRQAPSSNAEPAAEAAEPTRAHASSFSQALDGAKRRSKRRIPIAVLIALALALTAGVAFAAYQAYVHFVTPAAQEQPAEEQPAAEETEETDSEYDAAMAAYDEVLEQYREVLGMNGDASSATAQQDAYPLVNEAIFQDPRIEASSLQYCFMELNGDAIPELLIGIDVFIPEAIEMSGNEIWHGYTYTDGQLTEFLRGTSNNSYNLCDDLMIENFNKGERYEGSCGFYSLDGTELKSEEVIAWKPKSPSWEPDYPNGDFSLDATHYLDGETTPIPLMYGTDFFPFVHDYKQLTDIDWQTF